MKNYFIIICSYIFSVSDSLSHRGGVERSGTFKGCHYNRKSGDFHCHSKSIYNGKSWPNKDDALSSINNTKQKKQSATKYSRSLFGNWIDSDKDCLNTRHEILKARSLVPVKLNKDGCRVVSGVRKYEKKRIEKARFTDKRLSGNDYISDKEFKKIFNYCLKTKPSGDLNRYTSIAPFIWLSYHYGLRRSEAMAVNLECLRKEYLRITVQLKKVGQYEELKHGAEDRKIPHIFTEEDLRTVAGMLKLVQ